MCGICGIYYFDSNHRVDEERLRALAEPLSTRGPDAEGFWCKGNIGLGHKRLSIIDLSERANQPMRNEDGNLRLVANGEIYNFQRLREDLEAKGHRFSSESDSEVILHLYEEAGEECVKDLRGMFAFALWDEKREQLFLARDRVGQKPLYYTNWDGGFGFASDLKALLRLRECSRELDPLAIHHYLTYQYVPTPRTIFRSIRKLPPATTLTIRHGHSSTSRYWDLRYMEKLRYAGLQEYVEHFLEIFREAVRLRMIADVPLGAFLSGGIDSSSVVAMMSTVSEAPVKTFTIGFRESDFDETQYAGIVAKQYGTDHHHFVVEPKVFEIVPELVRLYSEPFADSSAIPTYLVSRETRRYVKVALNGDGGDESFAGYERYVADSLHSLFWNIPGWMRSGLIAPIARRIPHRPNQKSILRRVKRFGESLACSPEERYIQWLRFFDNEMKSALYHPDFRAQLDGVNSNELILQLFHAADGGALIDKTLYVDVHSYLPDDLLVKVDVATMAHSLEARSPYLDHRLMEFAAKLPSQLKLRRLRGKYLLRRAFAPLLPQQILRRRKMGFGVPLNHWFRHDLRDFLWDILLANRAKERGYFDPSYVERLLRDHQSRRSDHSARLWALLVLELWHREFHDGSV